MSKTVKKYMKELGITSFLKNTSDFITHAYYLNKPIGLSRKSNAFMKAALSRNIGDNIHEYDGYGTPIGDKADFFYNSKQNTNLYLKDFDKYKQNTTNYIEYINKTFFDENGGINNINNGIEKKNVEDFKVGAKRNIDLETYGVDSINPNSNNTDTLLGFISKNILFNTILEIDNNSNKFNSPITENIYNDFSITGKYGIEQGTYSTINGRVKTQDELIQSINTIPWSTSDHRYDSRRVGMDSIGNTELVKNIFDLHDNTPIFNYFTDNTKNSERSNLYYPFGNFYSNTYSLGLLDSTNELTKKFISKSMLGYDLLGGHIVDIDMKYNDIKAPKKYFVGVGTRGSNYIDKLSGTDVNFVKYYNEDLKSNEIVRFNFPDMGNDNLWSAKALYTYAEAEGNTVPNTIGTSVKTFNEGVEYGRHIAYDKTVTSIKNDIIHYTNRMFQDGKYKTLISRFHTDEIGVNGSRGNTDITSTSISQYGMSHGRNLLKFDHKNSETNGYSNPYCRTWTYHHQYSTLNDVIRPFEYDREKIINSAIDLNRTKEGTNKLFDYGVKHSNGLVRITPTYNDIDKGDLSYGVKRCMFSIENLAWKGEKDFFKGHEEQKGPLGGRIMWFPPYDLKFSENVNVNWSQNQFIGRGESIYTYTNTERGGNLSFKLLIDHPSVVNQWKGEITGGDNIGDVDDVGSNEQSLLRFFAGCELLKVAKIKEQEPKEKVIEVKKKDVELPPPSYDELVFYVFFPNNYSGVDDDADGVVKPMEYLINGIGANKYFTSNKTPIEDYGTNLSTNLIGYEMGRGGISVITPTKQTNFTSATTLTTHNGINLAYQYYNPNKVGGKNFWGYRCDKAYENQVLHTFNGNSKYNYYDADDFKLNANGFASLTQVHTNDAEKLANGRLFSFTDVFCALQPEAKNALKNNEYDENSVNIISSILGINKKGYSIERIDVRGFASSHGYKNSNNTLGQNRAKSVVKWLKKCNPSLFSIDYNYEDNKIGDKLSNYNSSSFLAKVWRCTRVSLKIRKEEIIEKSEVIDNAISLDNITYADNKTHREIIKNRAFVEMTDSRNQIDLKHNYKKAFGKELSNISVNSVANQLEVNKIEAELNALNASKNGNTFAITNNGKQGYGKEYEFFSMLDTKAPFLHSKLVEKLNYFDPAFHSITPEGFQSRLTFLHQCTRQGNTSSASDSNNKNRTANNLAFGRPPICVLRIGDFYNTKIIMESLTIDYDDTTWDLNDEGIGVMPMMANITISFKFLGGSDLSGPINRLQNALSFNHYANTSVYDDRAEEIEYDDKGNIKKFNFKK